MKVAVIGSGPQAAQTSIKFFDLGADVRIFATTDWSENAVPTSLLTQLMERQLKVSPCEVKRIHKAHLALQAPGFAGKSRLSDMFRVVISENPKTGVLKQMDENPEVFEKLGDKVLASLHEPMENFHDVDIVITSFDELCTWPGLSPSGAQVLNESRLLDQIYNSKNLPQDRSLLTKGRALVIGGNDKVLSYIASHCSEVTQLKVFNENTLSKEWFSFLRKADEKWEADKEIYQKKIHEWRGMEDYIRVKVPMPIEPKNTIQSYDDATLISLDLLVDQPGIFATIELVPDGNIVTEKFDHIFNARLPVWDHDKLKGLAIKSELLENSVVKTEPGFYTLQSNDTENTIEIIIKDVMNWFKPVAKI